MSPYEQVSSCLNHDEGPVRDMSVDEVELKVQHEAHKVADAMTVQHTVPMASWRAI